MAQEWRVPLSAGELYGKANRDGFIFYEQPKVEQGTSGAPLISLKGLIGIIIEDSNSGGVKVVDVEIVKKFVTEHRYPWDLPRCKKTVVKKKSKFIFKARLFEQDNVVILNWFTPKAKKTHKYRIYRFRHDEKNEKHQAIAETTQTVFQDDELFPCIKMLYQVGLVDEQGREFSKIELSEPITAHYLFAPPKPIQAALGNRYIHLNWKPVSNKKRCSFKSYMLEKCVDYLENSACIEWNNVTESCELDQLNANSCSVRKKEPLLYRIAVINQSNNQSAFSMLKP